VVADLVAWLGVNNTSQLLFGLEQPILFVAIPILGAGVAGFWASGAPITEFGALRGAFLGALALLSVVAILGLFRGPSLLDSMMFVLVFIFFGFIFVGWAAMLLGAFTGWLFKQHTKAPLCLTRRPRRVARPPAELVHRAL
jgi:hypothetical protein